MKNPNSQKIISLYDPSSFALVSTTHHLMWLVGPSRSYYWQEVGNIKMNTYAKCYLLSVVLGNLIPLLIYSHQ